MKTNLFVLVLLFISQITSAQELVVRYDYQDRSVDFLVNNRKIDKPSVKEGQAIRLELINYNNYIYDVEIKETFNEKKIGGNAFLGAMPCQTAFSTKG